MTTSICSEQVPAEVASWCLSKRKRLLDFTAAFAGLVILSPLLCLIAVAILLNSGKPVLFRQSRTGRNGREFNLLKFRTMRMAGAESASGLTQRGNSRVTPVGAFLRRFKLDELPQLINVLKGEMSLVGPRPDLRRFWLASSEQDRRVLSLMPGLTGAASLSFSDEETLLAQIAPDRLTSFYVDRILPIKSRMDMEYAVHATAFTDAAILLRTLFLPLLNHKNKKERYARIPQR